MIDEADHGAKVSAAFQWVSDMTHKFIIPNCSDPSEARAAFDFFAHSSFADHRVRFLLTLDALRRHCHLEGARIAEMGHMSGLSHWIKRQGTNVEELDGDFRYAINAPDNTYDILFSLEVLEHIKDQDQGSFDDLVLFNYSGVRACVREMQRILKPGGKLVLTTPNACSLWIVEETLQERTPWLHAPHVKEYAPSEVIEMCEEAGFYLQLFETFYAAHHLDPIDRAHRLERNFSALGYSAENRGDDAFYVFEKKCI